MKALLLYLQGAICFSKFHKMKFGHLVGSEDKAKELKIPYTSQIAQRRKPFDSNGPSWHLLALSFFKDPTTLLGTGSVHVKQFYARHMKNNDTKSQSVVTV